MTFTAEVVEKLAAPLDPKRVQKREGGGGRQLSYLEGHDAIRTANEIFGIGGWGYRVDSLECLGEEPVTSKYDKAGFRVAYRATVRVEVNGVEYGDVGYGDAQEYTGSRLTPHELASKEAVTDGLKRCLKNLGDQFGLCLYDKLAPEHDGRNGNGSGDAPSPASSRQGAVADVPASPASAPSSDEFRFKSGKHEGKTFAEVPRDYAVWCAENHPKPEIQQVAKVWLGLTSTALADDDIPF